jgi:hypothetical protein
MESSSKSPHQSEFAACTVPETTNPAGNREKKVTKSALNPTRSRQLEDRYGRLTGHRQKQSRGFLLLVPAPARDNAALCTY